MPVVAYFNGEYIDPVSPQVPIEERGHQYGDGVYEVVRVYGGRVFLLDWHLERLYRSLHTTRIENPYTHDEWVSLITEAVRMSNEAEATVYFQVTRGIASRQHLFPTTSPSVSFVVRPTKASAPQEGENKVICLPDERWANAFVKSINLLPNLLAKESAHRAGAKEALLVRNGTITEGSSSNAWFVIGDELVTAPTNRFILSGVTRRFILQLAQQAGITVREEAVSLEQLKTVDSIFMTGTTTEVLPIQSVLYSNSLLAAYHELPSSVPSTLLYEQPWEAYWARSTSNSVTEKVQYLFASAIEKFRNYEVV